MVVKGRVTRVLPGMQAAFVDIGLEKAAFLYVGDYLEDDGPPRSRRRRRRGRAAPRPRPPRQPRRCRTSRPCCARARRSWSRSRRSRSARKGARITSHVSIAGRHLVLTPWAKRVGVSRRIDSDRERRRLREVVTRLSGGKLGFIIRTAGEGTREADLEADVKLPELGLGRRSRSARTTSRAGRAVQELALPLRAIRDFANLAHAAHRDRRPRHLSHDAGVRRRASSRIRSRSSSSTRARCRSSTTSASRRTSTRTSAARSGCAPAAT